MADTTKPTVVASTFSDMKTLISELEPDVEKFTIQGNAAAGTRVRKGMQTLKDSAQTIRLEVQNEKNANKAEK